MMNWALSGRACSSSDSRLDEGDARRSVPLGRATRKDRCSTSRCEAHTLSKVFYGFCFHYINFLLCDFGVGQQPFKCQLVDAAGILGCGTELIDGVEDALVVFKAYISAVKHIRLQMCVHPCCPDNGITCDVETVAFGI